MAKHDFLKRVAAGLALLAALVAMGAAHAQQRKRMPVRTEPIPDTESGRPAGSSDPANPSMMIYGPPTPPLGAPPSPAVPLPEPAAAPAPAATPPRAPVATPAPAPVITPIPAAPTPVAVPVPAAVPAPEPVAVPVVPQVPPPAPVAVPAPSPAPLPAAIAAPAPAPVLAPAPVAMPAPVIVPPSAPLPVAIPAPVPSLVVVPPPAPAPVIATVAPASVTPLKLDAKAVEQIFSCLAPGLPQDWKRTWVVVSAETAVAAKFYFTASFRDEDAEEFVPCNVQEIARRITSLNEALPPDQRRWKSARLVIDNEGEFELKYDYAK